MSLSPVGIDVNLGDLLQPHSRRVHIITCNRVVSSGLFTKTVNHTTDKFLGDDGDFAKVLLPLLIQMTDDSSVLSFLSLSLCPSHIVAIRCS